MPDRVTRTSFTIGRMNDSEATIGEKSSMTDGHPIVENPLKFGPALSSEMFSRIRRRMALEHFKWDTQIGDENVLLGEPLLMDSKSWSKLASIAEQMATEI